MTRAATRAARTIRQISSDTVPGQRTFRMSGSEPQLAVWGYGRVGFSGASILMICGAAVWAGLGVVLPRMVLTTRDTSDT